MDELDFLIEYRQLLAAFMSAKEAAQAAPEDETLQAAWREQKFKMRAQRQFWRSIREWFKAIADAEGVVDESGDAVATPGTVNLKAKGNL